MDPPPPFQDVTNLLLIGLLAQQMFTELCCAGAGGYVHEQAAVMVLMIQLWGRQMLNKRPGK